MRISSISLGMASSRFACGLALTLVLYFFPGVSAAQAQDISFRYAGYAKNLAVRSKTFFLDDPFFLDISRLRTKGVVDAGNRIHAELWLDSELLAGDFLSTPEFELSQTAQRPTFMDLDWEIERGEHAQLRQSLFRAFATVYAGAATITFGRQRIAWGTGFAWNPTDLLNPFNPAAIELDEKTGVDAVYAVVPFATLSRAELAFAPGRGDLKSSIAGRVSSHVGEYDVSLMAGDFERDRVLGGDFAGYIGGGGLRGEFAYTWQDGGENFLRAVVNADYNFPGDVYAFIEFYYNGQGTTDKSEYAQRLDDLLSGRVFNLAKHYVALSANKSLTPLLGAGLYSLVNLDDRSSLIGPALTYSLFTNFEVSASAYLTTGADDSEYGLLSSSFFGYVQFYF